MSEIGGKTYVQHLRHHLQRTFESSVLESLLACLVEDVRPLEVLNSQHCVGSDR